MKRMLTLVLAVALCITAVLAPLPVHAGSEIAAEPEPVSACVFTVYDSQPQAVKVGSVNALRRYRSAYACGRLDLTKYVTREQIAAILYRYFYAADFLYGYSYPVPEGDLSAFPDAADVSGYAADAMLWATQSGLINGTLSGGKTVLAPKQCCTRAQIATIIMRLHPMMMPIDY